MEIRSVEAVDGEDFACVTVKPSSEEVLFCNFDRTVVGTYAVIGVKRSEAERIRSGDLQPLRQRLVPTGQEGAYNVQGSLAFVGAEGTPGSFLGPDETLFELHYSRIGLADSFLSSTPGQL